MRRLRQIAALALALALGLAVSLRAQERYPTPEFESGYEMPFATEPAPRAEWLEVMDVGVLVAALALASYFVIRLRRRGAVYALMLFCLAYFGFWRKGCVCSIGAIQNVAWAVCDGGYRVPWTVLAFFLLPLGFALFFGRTFCAAVCPLGAIQDVVALRPIRIPKWLSDTLGIGAYIYLGAAVLFAATGTGFLVCRYDPFVGFFRLSGPAWMLIAGAVLLAAGVVIARPYCRFLCPLGVLLGWCSRVSKWHARITPEECVRCRLCEDSCPVSAILPPVDRASESRARGTRRLALLLVLLPALVAGGAWAGVRLNVWLSKSDARVRVAEQVAMEEQGERSEMTLESEAFRQSGEGVPSLYEDARRRRGRIRIGGALFGAFVGLVVGGRLIEISTVRRRTGYEPDRAACVSCARCFAYCCKEQQRRAERSTDAGTADAGANTGREGTDLA